MAKQQMEIEGTSTEMSEACDAVLDARIAVDEAKKVLHAADAHLITMMRDDGKKSIKHDGRIFRLVHQEENNKIQIKSE